MLKFPQSIGRADGGGGEGRAQRARTRRSVLLTLAGGLALPAGAFGRPGSSQAGQRRKVSSLEGAWTNASLTALERPDLAPSVRLTAGEALVVEQKMAEAAARGSDGVGGRETEWWESDLHLARVGGEVRSAWIVDPADGRLPFTEGGRRLFAARRAATLTAFDDPETRPAAERCLIASWGAGGPPMLNAPYAANYTIVETPDAVVIVSEMNHEARIIRLEGGHSPPQLHPWMGDSVGRWEGDTLVIETVHFNPSEGYRSPFLLLSPDAKIIEWLTRVTDSELRYDFTVDDPAIYTQVWRGEMTFRATKGPVFEFACHEGNHSLANILSGARQRLPDGRSPSPDR